MLQTARLTIGYLLVPVLWFLCMPIPGGSSDAKGNFVALGFGLGGCPRKNLSSLSDIVAVRELSGDNPSPCIRYLHAPETWRAMRSESGSKTYRRWEPERSRHEAPSPAAQLPEGELVFFLLD